VGRGSRSIPLGAFGQSYEKGTCDVIATADTAAPHTGALQVNYTEGGLEAIIFTADGDMRQALNNLQATHSGFGLVSQDNVFKV
jgi:hypothetical protein